MGSETGTDRLLAESSKVINRPESLKHHDLHMEFLYFGDDKFDKKVKKALHKNEKDNYSN